MSKLNGVMISPTGLALLQGGDAGFLPGCKLIASTCQKLIINPNLCNCSDINEMPSNCLYTEGSTIDRMLEGFINLKECRTYNKILCVVNKPLGPASINATNAGIWGLGADISLLELETPLILKAKINEDGTAGGEVYGWEELCEQIKEISFDVLAIHTDIECPLDITMKYWNGELSVNPWGRAESILSKLISTRLNKQAVHGPCETQEDCLYDTLIVKQSQAPEIISLTYLFCCLKGLHKAPLIDITCDSKNLSNKDIDFMVSPMCWGRPHEACLRANIPVIIVKENTTCLTNVVFPDNKNIIFVNNYLEAAGIIQCMNAGVNYRTILL